MDNELFQEQNILADMEIHQIFLNYIAASTYSMRRVVHEDRN